MRKQKVIHNDHLPAQYPTGWMVAFYLLASETGINFFWIVFWIAFFIGSVLYILKKFTEFQMKIKGFN